MRKADFSKLKKKKMTPEEEEKEFYKDAADTYDWIQSLAVALIICVVVFVFFIRIIDVNGSSMVPTLANEDKMLVSGLLYTPKQGDIVVFKTDSYDSNKALVKRVIATEGQVVNIDFDNGIVYVDGEALDEYYTNELTFNKLDFIGPQTVPDGCVFLMGDNRNASTDSRDDRIGMVDSRLIIGKVYAIIYPMQHMKWITVDTSIYEPEPSESPAADAVTDESATDETASPSEAEKEEVSVTEPVTNESNTNESGNNESK